MWPWQVGSSWIIWSDLSNKWCICWSWGGGATHPSPFSIPILHQHLETGEGVGSGQNSGSSVFIFFRDPSNFVVFPGNVLPAGRSASSVGEQGSIRNFNPKIHKYSRLKPGFVTRKSIPSLNCFNTARYTHLVQLTIAMLCLVSLSVCIIAL